MTPMQQDTVSGGGSMNDVVTKLIRNNSKVKYGLVLIILPIIVVVTLLQGGSLGDIFSQKISRTELRELVRDEINGNKSRYGFSASTVTCQDSLKRERGATVGCSVNANRTIGGDIEGQLDVTVVVVGNTTGSAPTDIEIQNVTLSK
jgi:hypothetical protein